MILRKPYALFIKLFKPLHIVFGMLVTYLIYLENNMLTFLKNYIYNTGFSTNIETVKDILSDWVFILPIILIIFSFLMLCIMFKKKKPTTFYLISIIAYIAIIIINVYATNLINVILSTTVSIKSAKLIHDLILINIIIETIIVVFYIIRGTGLNFKRFDFSSDLSKLDISSGDNEEIEVNIDFNIDEAKRKRKEKLRNLKYTYLENKFLINIITTIFVFIILILVIILIITNKPQIEGNLYSAYPINIKINSTSIVNKDYNGKKITNNNLVVVNTLVSSYSKEKIDLNDFKLDIEGVRFKPTTKYATSLLDLGDSFKTKKLTSDLSEYIFTFEVPDKYISEDMYFIYSGFNSKLNVKLSPKEQKRYDKAKTVKIGDEIDFKETLGDISFKINSYEINPYYKIEYDYCYKDKTCMKSYEYLKPSIDENFDKAVMKLNVEYNNNTTNSLYSFYDFINAFAKIYYITGESVDLQTKGFEKIISKKIKEKNVVYLGVKNNILNANVVYFEFDMRGYKYRYVLKGDL